MKNAREVCEALGLGPDVMADLFRRTLARELRELADSIENGFNPDWTRAQHYAVLITELDGEWEREHEDDADLERQLFAGEHRDDWALDEERGGGEAKEATDAAAAAWPEGSP